MKIAPRQIDSFIKAPTPGVRAVLVYGPDDGLMRERAKAVGRTAVADLNDPFNVSVLNASAVVEDSARLSDEANALSMMGGKRLVRIEDGRDAIAPALKDYLQNPNAATLIVIEAGELTPRSALRILFEKSEAAAAIACYVEDERDIAGLIRSSLQEQGFSIASDAAALLASSITGDRLRARSEIEKLVTYMGAEKQVKLEDVQACCGQAGAQSLDNLVYGAAGAKPAEAFRAFNNLLEEGVPPIVILRALQNHFRRLHFAKAKVEKGIPAEDAMKTLSPPVFFKQESLFRMQINRWKMPALEKTLGRLALLESQCKQSAMPAETLCSQALLAISNMK